MFPNDAGIITDPPILEHKEGRTHCEVCQEPLQPDVHHKCHGNQPADPLPTVARPPDLSNYHGVCPKCQGARTPPDHLGEPCDVCDGEGVIP